MQHRIPLGAIAIFALLACQSDTATPTRTFDPSTATAVRLPPGTDLLTWLRRRVNRGRASRNGGEPALLAGAGDIARCYPGSNAMQFQAPDANNPAMQRAALLEAMPTAPVMAVGDTAYEFGSPLDYAGCYHPTWGRFRDRTRPATGNHEYLPPAAAGYFGYFGERSAPP